AATFPLPDDVVALGDQIRRAPEIEIGECGTEIGHERPDVGTAAARFMQRVFEQHVRRGNLVDDGKIDILAPELGKPAADNGLVSLFLAHWNASSSSVARGSSASIDDPSEDLRLRRSGQTPVLALTSDVALVLAVHPSLPVHEPDSSNTRGRIPASSPTPLPASARATPPAASRPSRRSATAWGTCPIPAAAS